MNEYFEEKHMLVDADKSAIKDFILEQTSIKA